MLTARAMLDASTQPDHATDQATSDPLPGNLKEPTVENLLASVPARRPGWANSLSKMERAWAAHFVLNGGVPTTAAQAAGYASPKASGRANMCKTKVMDFVARLCAANLKAALPVAIKALVEICSDPKADAKARVSAAVAILDRGGMRPHASTPAVAVQVNLNGRELTGVIADVWQARQSRLAQLPDLSVISAGMTDTADDPEGREDG